MPDASDFERVLATLRREFAAGLPRRAATLDAALARLRAAFARPLAEEFQRTAHTLKGTAAEFGAHEISSRAAALDELGRLWLTAGAVAPDEVAAAAAHLEQLRTAIARWAVQVEGTS